jgi:type II secretory pathway pseudopilin PulG
MRRRAGFSMIELLVATSLSVMLISLVAGIMLHTSRTAAITTEILAMHDSAASISRMLGDRLQAQQPNTSWHLTADPGPDATWGTGDERCALTFMASVPDRSDRQGGFRTPDLIALDWYRLSWTGPDATGTGSSLTWADTGGSRATGDYVGNWTVPWPDPLASSVDNFSYKMRIIAEPRRDRRRDLDDNDLRLIEGMTSAQYRKLYDNNGTAGPLPGDAASMTLRAMPLVHPTNVVSNLLISWIDRAGWETRFDPTLGIVRHDANGNVVAPPAGAPWLSQRRVSLDGVFVDARAYSMSAVSGEPADPRDIATARPVLLRLAFTLRRPPPPQARARDAIEQRFSFAIPLQPNQSSPSKTWAMGAP